MASESIILTDNFYFSKLNSQITVRVSSTKVSTYLVIMTKTVGNVPKSVETWTNTHKETAKQNRVLITQPVLTEVSLARSSQGR